MEDRVRQHLRAGETLRAAVWVSRADDTPTKVTRADMSPIRFRRATPGARRGLHGAPLSLAAGLDKHIQVVTDPRVLALTDRRLMVLAKGIGSWRDLLRRTADPRVPLRVRWECPRADLASATGNGGRLRLDLTDGSAVTLITPSAAAGAFLAACATP